MSFKLPVYMDYPATTPLDSRILDDMLPYFCEKFGNPHSNSHSFGIEASDAVENARRQVAELINATPQEIIFTSGATESNNIALKGVARFYSSDKKNHIITLDTEHKCVLSSCYDLEQEGFKVTYLPVQSDGLVDLQLLENTINDSTIVVSIMFVNNEIGVIQPIEDISKICQKHNVFFHTDAAQAFGKIPIDTKQMQIDLMSISGHKIYGPKGIGALFIKTRKPRIRLKPIISGGGQERGIRSGTLSTPLVVGLGSAAKHAMKEMKSNYDYISKLSTRFVDAILQMPYVYLNGSATSRFPGCLNFSFAGVEGESIMGLMSDIAVSSGSACTSDSLQPSHVIDSLGSDPDLVHTSIRFGIGKFTTNEEIDYVIDTVYKTISRLRDMSPVWYNLMKSINP